MTLGEIKRVLASGNIQLTKSLGQNFLHDQQQLKRIVEAADLTSEDQVLEIGPGLGPLTQLLLGKNPHVLAIEKDQRLYNFLRTRWPEEPRLTLLQQDALQYLQQERPDLSEWKVVSNLPYSVASPILVELAKAAGAPRRIVVTLQLEVVKRLAASAGDDDYGVLSLLIQLRYEPRGWFKIPPACFFPVPDVDSACITLDRRQQALLEPELSRQFEKIVKRGFSQRRKMMLKLLKADWPLPRLETAFERLNISKQARAETVSLSEYIELTRLLTSKSLPSNE